MSDRTSPPRRFDRAEVESILLEAARLDEARGSDARSTMVVRAGDEALTLGEIERAAAEVGISQAAVSHAALRVVLRSASAAAPRVNAVREITGALPADALERIADDLRTELPSARTRVTAEEIDVELGRANGEPGSLLVKLRARAESSMLSVWSAAPSLSRGEVAGLAAFFVPPALLPVVAVAGGTWPALASTVAYALGALGVGAGAGLALSRWRIGRWNTRVEAAVSAIVASVERHATRRVVAPTTDVSPSLGED
jgi:hypothetical protein